MAEDQSTENVPVEPKNWPAVGMHGWIEGEWDNDYEPCLEDVDRLECVIVVGDDGGLYYVFLHPRIDPQKKNDWCNLRAHPLDKNFHPSPEAALRAHALSEEEHGKETLDFAARLRGLADEVERRRHA